MGFHTPHQQPVTEVAEDETSDQPKQLMDYETDGDDSVSVHGLLSAM
jgi:hypothetical protein